MSPEKETELYTEKRLVDASRDGISEHAICRELTDFPLETSPPCFTYLLTSGSSFFRSSVVALIEMTEYHGCSFTLLSYN